MLHQTNNHDLIRIFYHPWFIYRNMSPLSLYDLKDFNLFPCLAMVVWINYLRMII